MSYMIELGVALVLTIIFYKTENPKIRYLFYGYVFFAVALILQLPFRFIEVQLKEWFEFALLSQILIAPFIIIISEITKYLTLKRFLNTSSFKNGVFFGIGWVTLESINLFTIAIVSYFLGFFTISFDMTSLLNPEYGAFNFLYFFIINIAVTVFVIKAVISDKKGYVVHAIIYSLIIYYGLLLLGGLHKNTFALTSLGVSTAIIFSYKYIK